MEPLKSVPRPLAALSLAVTLAAPIASAQQQKDLVDTAIQAGNLSKFTSMLVAAGLVDTLRAKGPFTVFAPSDDAFARLSKADLDALLADKARLAEVLRYHVVPGRLTAADVAAMQTAKPVAGGELRFSAAAKIGPTGKIGPSGNIGPGSAVKTTSTDPEAGLAKAEAITKAASPENAADTAKAFAVVGAIVEGAKPYMGGGLKVNDAVVVKADLLASNGVIHTIDAVLQPR